MNNITRDNKVQKAFGDTLQKWKKENGYVQSYEPLYGSRRILLPPQHHLAGPDLKIWDIIFDHEQKKLQEKFDQIGKVKSSNDSSENESISMEVDNDSSENTSFESQSQEKMLIDLTQDTSSSTKSFENRDAPETKIQKKMIIDLCSQTTSSSTNSFLKTDSVEEKENDILMHPPNVSPLPSTPSLDSDELDALVALLPSVSDTESSTKPFDDFSFPPPPPFV